MYIYVCVCMYVLKNGCRIYASDFYNEEILRVFSVIK